MWRMYDDGRESDGELISAASFSSPAHIFEHGGSERCHRTAPIHGQCQTRGRQPLGAERTKLDRL